MKTSMMWSAWMLSFAMGCTETVKTSECTTNKECDEGSICVQERCRAVECMTAEDCGLGKICAENHTCTPGCEKDSDCLAGESCNEGTCAPYGCRDTQLDCNYGEICDPTTGSCYPDEAGACTECTPGASRTCLPNEERGPCSGTGGCPSGQECYIAELDDARTCRTASECPSGWICSAVDNGSGGTAGPYCLRAACFTGANFPSCDPNAETDTCARGFQCTDYGTGGICFADCAWLTENGYLSVR